MNKKVRYTFGYINPELIYKNKTIIYKKKNIC